jgi:hypothetical protein
LGTQVRFLVAVLLLALPAGCSAARGGGGQYPQLLPWERFFAPQAAAIVDPGPALQARGADLRARAAALRGG